MTSPNHAKFAKEDAKLAKRFFALTLRLWVNSGSTVWTMRITVTCRDQEKCRQEWRHGRPEACSTSNGLMQTGQFFGVKAVLGEFLGQILQEFLGPRDVVIAQRCHSE